MKPIIKWIGTDGKPRVIKPKIDGAIIGRVMRRLKRVCDFPNNTCPASRHVEMIGEALGKRKPYPMLTEEPEHCAISMLATVAALWEARTKIKKLEARIAKMKASEP